MQPRASVLWPTNSTLCSPNHARPCSALRSWTVATPLPTAVGSMPLAAGDQEAGWPYSSMSQSRSRSGSTACAAPGLLASKSPASDPNLSSWPPPIGPNSSPPSPQHHGDMEQSSLAPSWVLSSLLTETDSWSGKAAFCGVPGEEQPPRAARPAGKRVAAKGSSALSRAASNCASRSSSAVSSAPVLIRLRALAAAHGSASTSPLPLAGQATASTTAAPVGVPIKCSWA
mmetsp:Transcript_19563/g.50083  ORF Transcript_19563/g.50083 Transcript_19563/m.50083 type:complete len:229 (-) Transcript_19563:53-739(-)